MTNYRIADTCTYCTSCRIYPNWEDSEYYCDKRKAFVGERWVCDAFELLVGRLDVITDEEYEELK